MSSASPRIPLTRRIIFIFLAAVLAAIIIEIAAALLLGLAEGGWPSLSEFEARRSTVLEGRDRADSVMPAVHRDGAKVSETLHPYFGFSQSPRVDQGTAPRAQAEQGATPGAFEDRLFFEPSQERTVVAVLGGSVADIVATGGSGLAVELRQVDRFNRREIVVISLAQGGFKQPQQVTLLAYLLALGAHFDLVINIDGFNEVALPATELVPRGVFPFYPRGWDQRVGPLDSESRRVAADLSLSRRQRRDLARRFSVWPWQLSRTAALTWRALDARATRNIAAAELLLLQTGSEEASYGSHGPRRSYDSPDEMYEDLAQFWYRSSLQMYHLCRSQGIEYHHFLQPNQYHEASKPVAAERVAGTWLAEQPYRPAVEQGYPRLIRLGRELAKYGVAFEDLSAIFADRHELLYGDSCCHLNFLGNTLLQRAIAHRLADGGFERPENLSDGGLALEGYDPVSYFDLEPTRGSREIMATHGGIHYRFASDANRARFLATPERYLPRYGGWCAFGLGMDEAAMGVPRGRYPVDPESYEISGGQLHLFYRSPIHDARAHWRRDPDGIRQRADETWQRLRER